MQMTWKVKSNEWQHQKKTVKATVLEEAFVIIQKHYQSDTAVVKVNPVKGFKGGFFGTALFSVNFEALIIFHETGPRFPNLWN
jgi:hypothetical protein